MAKTKELRKRYGAEEGRIITSVLERSVSRERLFLFSAMLAVDEVGFHITNRVAVGRWGGWCVGVVGDTGTTGTVAFHPPLVRGKASGQLVPHFLDGAGGVN